MVKIRIVRYHQVNFKTEFRIGGMNYLMITMNYLALNYKIPGVMYKNSRWLYSSSK
ncbi:hypothetical protein C8J95_10382 [Elizabethkingia sp. YR214]|nr:hypothetical protein C8J95_10382 [Elizabethkingia sp. YR214]